MNWAERLLRFNVIVICSIAILIGAYSLFQIIQDLVFVLVFSLLCTLLLLKPVYWLQRFLERRFRFLSRFHLRIIAVILVYFGFFTLIGVSAFRFLPTLSVQVQDFTRTLPTYFNEAQARINRFVPSVSSMNAISSPATLSPKNTQNVPPSSSESAHSLSPILSYVQDSHFRALETFISWMTGSMAGIVVSLTSFVLIFYLLLDGASLKLGFIELMPRSVKPVVSRHIEQIQRYLYHLTHYQCFFGLLGGIYFYASFKLLGIHFAGLLAIIFGSLSIFPILGPLVGLLPAFLVILFSRQSLDLLLFLLATGFFFLIKFYGLTPRLFKEHLPLHPVLILLVTLSCVRISGFMGILLILPALSLLSVLLISQQRDSIQESR